MVEAISRTVIHKTITTCVAISTTVFKIGLYCEDKALENSGAEVRPARPASNISHVETFDQFGETIHFGTLIKLVGLPSFTHLSITIVNVSVCVVNVINIFLQTAVMPYLARFFSLDNYSLDNYSFAQLFTIR